MESVHQDNIFLIKDFSTPKEMWEALRDCLCQMTSVSQFFLLCSLMAMSVSEDNNISSHIIKIGAVGSWLCKLCKNGMILIEDVQTASLIASLPETFTSVTSPFKQREDTRFKYVSKAVVCHIMTCKNQANQLTSTFSSTLTPPKLRICSLILNLLPWSRRKARRKTPLTCLTPVRVPVRSVRGNITTLALACRKRTRTWTQSKMTSSNNSPPEKWT